MSCDARQVLNVEAAAEERVEPCMEPAVAPKEVAVVSVVERGLPRMEVAAVPSREGYLLGGDQRGAPSCF